MEDQSLDIWTLEAHRLSQAKGFWPNNSPTHLAAKIALMHAELSELLEAVRDDPCAPCDKPIPLSREEEEVADVFLRLCDYCGERGINLGRVAMVKHDYNKTREHQHGKRL